MAAADIFLHCVAAGLAACSLCCIYKERNELETGFTPCPIGERTARIIGKYAFGESSISIDARSLKVEESNGQYHILSSDHSDAMLVVRRMGGNFHWERKSSEVLRQNALENRNIPAENERRRSWGFMYIKE